MGKLHSLRRAIERNPESWILTWGKWGPRQEFYALYANRPRPRSPDWSPGYNAWKGGPYRNFVRSVLKELGYDSR